MSINTKNTDQYKKVFGSLLKQIRESKGLSQLDLAARCGMEKSSISRIENGRTNITLTSAVLLSSSLEVPLKMLFDFDVEATQKN